MTCDLISSLIMFELSFSKYIDNKGLFLKNNSFNALYIMMDSGARGSESQIKQICSNRGLMSYKNQGILEIPALSSLREGLSVFEYFYFSHNSRKTLADTALKTASAGYLTRRLVESSNNIFISEKDCNTNEGIVFKSLIHQGEIVEEFFDRIFGRIILNDYIFTNENISIKKNTMINDDIIFLLKKNNIDSLKIRTPLKCKSRIGICSLCYGLDLSKGKIVDVGIMVGIIAAQSIGEPGTQLTMRTFHTGGVINKFVKKSFFKSSSDGFLLYSSSLKYIFNKNNFKIVISKIGKIKIFNNFKEELENFNIPYSSILLVENNTNVKKGDLLCKWDSDYNLIISEYKGLIKFNNFIENFNFIKRVDIKCIEIIKSKFLPYISIYNDNKNLYTYDLYPGDLVMFEDNQEVEIGDILIKIPLNFVASKDIVGGLPKIDNFFEARVPKNPAIISPLDGFIKFKTLKKKKIINIVDSKENIIFSMFLKSYLNLMVFENQFISKGDIIIDGDINPHDILFIYGFDYLVNFLLEEIKYVYSSQAVKINDKHIEIIISQMLKNAIIISPGKSNFLPGEIIPIKDIENLNRNFKLIDKIKYEIVLSGITNNSLKNESFLSAASFQKTGYVLSQAAVNSSYDNMSSLKSMAMLGEVFTAGSGAYNKILNF